MSIEESRPIDQLEQLRQSLLAASAGMIFKTPSKHFIGRWRAISEAAASSHRKYWHADPWCRCGRDTLIADFQDRADHHRASEPDSPLVRGKRDPKGAETHIGDTVHGTFPLRTPPDPNDHLFVRTSPTEISVLGSWVWCTKTMKRTRS